jgi:hypothetical protein
MIKFLLGVLVGFFILLVIYFCYSKFFIDERFNNESNNSSISISPKTNQEANSLIEYKIALSNFEEKISSLNKRFDDLLIFEGIIITLLLGISVAVYVNAESIVEKHLKENYEKYNAKIKSYADQSETDFIKLQTQIDLTMDLKEKLAQKQEIIHDANDSN